MWRAVLFVVGLVLGFGIRSIGAPIVVTDASAWALSEAAVTEIVSLQDLRSVRMEVMVETGRNLEAAIDLLDQTRELEPQVDSQDSAMALYSVAASSARLAIDGLDFALDTWAAESRSCFAVVQEVEYLVPAEHR